MLHGNSVRIGGFRERLWFWGEGLDQEGDWCLNKMEM